MSRDLCKHRQSGNLHRCMFGIKMGKCIPSCSRWPTAALTRVLHDLLESLFSILILLTVYGNKVSPELHTCNASSEHELRPQVATIFSSNRSVIKTGIQHVYKNSVNKRMLMMQSETSPACLLLLWRIVKIRATQMVNSSDPHFMQSVRMEAEQATVQRRSCTMCHL